MDATMAIILAFVLLFVVVFGSLFGADSRPAWKNVERKPRFRMTGSMRPSDWKRSQDDR
jgi:tryptophan-rich sensory protein